MPKFSKSSLRKLATCHEDLQSVFNEVIKTHDCTILCGYRSEVEQFTLYKLGRDYRDGVLRVVNPAKVVTYKDGRTNKSRHNYVPSQAVDVAPYPIDWADISRFIEFGKVVRREIDIQLKYGKITHDITWGGDWSFKDYPHWQIKL